MDKTKVIGYISVNNEGQLLSTEDGELIILGNQDSFKILYKANSNILLSLKKIRCKDVIRYINNGTPCNLDRCSYSRFYEHYLKDSGIKNISSPEDAFANAETDNGNVSVITMSLKR